MRYKSHLFIQRLKRAKSSEFNLRRNLATDIKALSTSLKYSLALAVTLEELPYLRASPAHNLEYLFSSLLTYPPRLLVISTSLYNDGFSSTQLCVHRFCCQDPNWTVPRVCPGESLNLPTLSDIQRRSLASQTAIQLGSHAIKCILCQPLNTQ